LIPFGAGWPVQRRRAESGVGSREVFPRPHRIISDPSDRVLGHDVAIICYPGDPAYIFASWLMAVVFK
jgi:hypothetical protein